MAKLRLEVQGLLEIQEQVMVELLNEPGLHLTELRDRVEAATGCAGSTVGKAITQLNQEGSFTKKRDAKMIRYYWDDEATFAMNERVLPVRRPVIRASDIPSRGGLRLDPIQWAVKILEAA